MVDFMYFFLFDLYFYVEASITPCYFDSMLDMMFHVAYIYQYGNIFIRLLLRNSCLNTFDLYK